MSDELPALPLELSLGCDYISASISRDLPEFVEVTTAWWDILHKERLATGLIEDMGMMGYNGMSAGAVFVGSRFDGMFLRISGATADTHLMQYLDAPGRCTRIDFQVTLRYGDAWRLMLNGCRSWATIANERLPLPRRRKVREVNDDDQGHTVYVGARSSTAFGRIYHKWAKDKDRYEPGDLRFEVELHKGFARDAIEKMNNWEGNGYHWMGAFLWDWWKERGINIPFITYDRVSSRWTDVLDDTPLSQKLNWLQTQVAPTARLLADQGHTAEVFRVLFGPQWLEFLLGRLTEEGSYSDAPPADPPDDTPW
jgi:DNA relaxase NicK